VLFTFFISLVGERFGRRRLLVGFSLISAAAGSALVWSQSAFLLIAASFAGSLGHGVTGAAGPTQPLEQACLADIVPTNRRTELFAAYRVVSNFAAAMGALAAGLPTLLQNVFGLDEGEGFQVMFLGFVLCLLLVALLYWRLSPAVEVTSTKGGWTNPLRLPSRRIIFTLTGLFSIDRFAGSLMIQSLATYWFYTRFGLELASLALVFFLSELLSALSLWLSAKLANRVGLINTMVFTHIPANLLLIGAAFALSSWLAVVFCNFGPS
jgi:MFS family permease